MTYESARLATTDDLDAIAMIGEAVLEPLPEARGGPIFTALEIGFDTPSGRALKALSEPDSAGCAVGEFDGLVFGYAVWTIELLDGGGTLGRLHDFAVHPEARGVGIGEAMMDLLVADLNDRGCVGVDAWALPGDRATKNFFESFGLKARLLTAHRALR
jgi:ribosomal protein S18 acetylase RimI-like enzyme